MSDGTEKKSGGIIRKVIAKSTSFPSDMEVHEFRMEMFGKKTLYIYGCRRILTYSPVEIEVSTGKFSIKTTGEKLLCSTFHEGTVCINGDICKIELLGKGETNK